MADSYPWISSAKPADDVQTEQHKAGRTYRQAALLIALDEVHDRWLPWRPLDIPSMRRQGYRHVVVITKEGSRYLQREWIASRGEVTRVLVDTDGSAAGGEIANLRALAAALLDKPHSFDFGNGQRRVPATIKEVTIKTQTRRWRAVTYLPSSTSYAKHVLGWRKARIVTPYQLCYYVEQGELPYGTGLLARSWRLGLWLLGKILGVATYPFRRTVKA